jgi:hypothetical protein
MDISTVAGSKVSITAAPVILSTTDTQAEFAALTYTEIKPVESIGGIGDTANNVTFTELGNSRTRNLKGARAAKLPTVVVGYVADDPGQILAIAAEQTKFDYGVKVELADKGPGSGALNTIIYFGAQVSEASFENGDADTVEKLSITFLPNTKPFIVPGTPGT